MSKLFSKPGLLVMGVAALAAIGVALSTNEAPETKPPEDGSSPVVLGEPDAPTEETDSLATYVDDVGNERYVATGRLANMDESKVQDWTRE